MWKRLINVVDHLFYIMFFAPCVMNDAIIAFRLLSVKSKKSLFSSGSNTVCFSFDFVRFSDNLLTLYCASELKQCIQAVLNFGCGNAAIAAISPLSVILKYRSNLTSYLIIKSLIRDLYISTALFSISLFHIHLILINVVNR